MLRIAICGGSGYTGSELIRLLLGHPFVEITAVTSERSKGKSVSELFPHLCKCRDLTYEPLEKQVLLKKADLFFMALPHGTSQLPVDFFFRHGKKVIDLSADYRLKDPKVYEDWYKVSHKFISTIKRAVYGLPELYRERIKKADLIANPGCYPTGALLGMYPLLKAKLIEPKGIVIDSKSGASGAGRQSDIAFSFSEVNEGFRAYGLAVHRHTPEIEQEISAFLRKSVIVDFTPHLIPLDRGILTTMYVKLRGIKHTKDLYRLYKRTYAKEPFINVLEEGMYPNVKDVRGSNLCEIGFKMNKRTGTLIIVTAIDNLVKGASGQAVQNMNIMMGFDERTALSASGIHP
ncbi:MAG: N-acetyl-gamma-glutamyl-phosphate reductase [Nitrospirae bacterium]|nr:N-acetyl-gamma-glutamyl-phosphate reductase [Nitrospirota bacterium]